MIPVVIFTFAGDGAAAMMAGKSAIAAGLGPVFIEIDGAKPLTPEMRAAMKRQGFRVRETMFPRNKGIRGIDCYRGLLGSYSYALRDTGASHVLKLDSDTLVFRADRIKQAVADDVAAASMRTDGYRFYGCAMVLSSRLVSGIAAHVQRWKGIPGHRNHDLSEDIATGDMADLLDIGEVRRWPFDPAGGYCAGWRYDDTPPEVYRERFDVVTFGNRHLLTGKDCERRDKVAETMARFTVATSTPA